MSEFETFECATCDGQFAAHPDSNAATGGYCSPSCEEDGKGLA